MQGLSVIKKLIIKVIHKVGERSVHDETSGPPSHAQRKVSLRVYNGFGVVVPNPGVRVSLVVRQSRLDGTGVNLKS